jgi:hypothetical protein
VDDILQLLGHLAPSELLLDPGRGAPSNAYFVLLGFFVVLFIAGVIAATRATKLSRGNRLHERMLDLYGQWGAWLGLAGIVIVGMRFSNAQLLSKRIWTILDLLAILAVTAHFLNYRIRRYPAEIADYREEERKRRYLPGARRRRR